MESTPPENATTTRSRRMSQVRNASTFTERASIAAKLDRDRLDVNSHIIRA